MKATVFVFYFMLLMSCQETAKIDLNDFLFGGAWCGKSQMAGAYVCLEFMEHKVLIKIDGTADSADYFQYSILEIDAVEQKILWELKNEGLVNIFKVIDQNTVELIQEDIPMEPSKFYRSY